MVAAAREAKRFLIMCSARARYTPAALRAHEMIEGGELGRVYHGRSSQFRQRGRPGVDILRDATWFISKERAGGGALIDIGVYDIDLMLWLMGNPAVRSVSAAIDQGKQEPRDDRPRPLDAHLALAAHLPPGGAPARQLARTPTAIA